MKKQFYHAMLVALFFAPFNGFGQNSTITDVDGNTYKTVKIDNQTWMAENLRTTKYNDGNTISNVTDSAEWVNLSTPAYCWYNNDKDSLGKIYGALYNWYTVDTKKLCPSGWKVPTVEDWDQLIKFLGGDTIACNKLKETGSNHWPSPNSESTNESGFSAIPAGGKGYLGIFNRVGKETYWWSSSLDVNSYALTRNIYNYENRVAKGGGHKDFGFSVRCLKDTAIQTTLPVISTTAISDIFQSKATSGGNITSDGDAAISAKGICWSTSPSPTTANSKTIDGTGTGSFTSSITGLSASTKYYVRAYATNSAGTAYGNEVSFTTLAATSDTINLTSGLVAYYPFNGNVNDKSGNGNNGTEYSSAQYITGKESLAHKFTNDITNTNYDYLKVPNTINSEYSISFWSQISDSSRYNSFLYLGSTNDWVKCDLWVFMNAGGKIGVIQDKNDLRSSDYSHEQLVNGNLNANYDNSPILHSNIPYNIIVTYSKSILKIYINGDLSATYDNVSAINSSADSIIIGVTPRISTPPLFNYQLDGWLDDLRLYNRTLSAEEVKALYQETSVNLNSGLVAYYPFNGNAYDESGSGRNGVAYGASLTSDKDGKANSAYSFNGTTNYINLPSSGLNMNTYSYSAWFKCNELPTTGYPMAILGIGSVGGDQYITYAKVNGILQLQYGSYGGGSCVDTIILKPDTWYHVVCTFNDEKLQMFLNDTLVSSSNTIGLPSYGPKSLTATIGSRAEQQNPFNGSIDEVRIYNRVLNNDEVNALYGSSPTITDADDNSYKTVTIGSQTWMAENLKTTKYNDGSAIPNVTDNIAWSNLTTPAYCWYNNDKDSLGKIYGVLYNWYTVDTKKLCPTGWHVPTISELTTMEIYLQNNDYNYDGTLDTDEDWQTNNKIGKSLASLTNWNASTEEGAVGNADYLTYRNKSGFTAFPGGMRYDYGSFYHIGNLAGWWSSSDDDYGNAWGHHIVFNSSSVYEYYNSKKAGFSVRCLKDTTIQATLPVIATTSISNITQTSAISGGNISSDGGATISARGICWSTTPAPTTANNKTSDGTGTGSFTSSITALSASTKYYVRAYATNSAGTAYGNEVSFSTKNLGEKSYQTITFNAFPKVSYGSPDLTFSASASSGLALIFSSSNNSIATIADNKIHLIKPGKCYIKAYQAGNTEYFPARDSQLLVVQKAMLYILADNKVKDCGEDNPPLSCSYYGFINNDDESVLLTKPIVKTVVMKTTPAGEYSTNASGASALNYSIGYINGVFYVNALKSSKQFINCCSSTYRLPGGKIINKPGVYSDTLVSQNGCDSIAIFDISFVVAYTKEITKNMCQGEVYRVGKSEYTKAGIYKDTLFSSAGCDSVYITTTLSFDEEPTLSINNDTAICIGETVSLRAEGIGKINWFGTSKQTMKVKPEQSTLYTASSSNQCGVIYESVYVLVNSRPETPEIFASEKTLYTLTDSHIQWYEEILGKIEGANNWEFEPKANGNYFVVASNSECYSEPSDHYSFTFITNIASKDNIAASLYPNPVTDNLYISSNSEINSVELYSSKGLLINKISTAPQSIMTIDTRTLKSGMYFVRIFTKDKTLVKKIMKQ